MVVDHQQKQTIEFSCQEVVNAVRSSQLNFAIQETPFSLYFTVRKSLNKSSNCDFSFKQPNEHLANEQETFQTKLKALQEANWILKKNYEEALLDAETFAKENHSLKNKIDILCEKLSKAEEKNEAIVAQKAKAINDEKKSLQTKHEKLIADFKCLKNENDDAGK